MSNFHAGGAGSPGDAQEARRGIVCRAVGRFKTNERGTVAVIFAMMSVIMIGVMGGAVDYGRWLAARSETHNAIDTAVLAGGRVLQLAGTGATEAEAAFFSGTRSR